MSGRVILMAMILVTNLSSVSFMVPFLPFRQIVWEAASAGQTLHNVSQVLAEDGAH